MDISINANDGVPEKECVCVGWPDGQMPRQGKATRTGLFKIQFHP